MHTVHLELAADLRRVLKAVDHCDWFNCGQSREQVKALLCELCEDVARRLNLGPEFLAICDPNYRKSSP